MQAPDRLAAAGGLTLHFDTPHWRVTWNGADWLGPLAFVLDNGGHRYHGGRTRDAKTDGRQLHPHLAIAESQDDLGPAHNVEISWDGSPLPVRTSVRAYAERPLIVFRLEAGADLTNLHTGDFARPSAAWPVFLPAHGDQSRTASEVRCFGYQYSEFALPVVGSADATGFLFAPHRPPIVEPLLFIATDGRTLLLAPLNHFHDQIISLPGSADQVADGVRCGWHGDLDRVAAGFATEIALWAGTGPRAVLQQWADLLRRRHATQRLSRYCDPLLAKLSYWTDNGAVYYYRTEPGCDYLTTLEHVVKDLRTNQVPIGSLQLDSWFYPHENLRAVSPDGAPLVPPSGMLTWEPRPDLFPDGFADLSQRIGRLPLTFHSRHFSRQSPYFDTYAAWRDGEYAHPVDPALFDRLMAQASGWGAITYEQDWMVESFLGVRGLREEPGRAQAWQESMDRAAEAHGLHLQFCMATPADFLETLTLCNVASIRTSGDYRYLFDNGLNWNWFLQTNVLARILGLHPFKDVFISHGATPTHPGDPCAEVEALLASLSTGPVAIGDARGFTNRELVMRTCREDGVLIKPDVPVAALDRCLRANAFAEPVVLVGETYSDHPAGRWMYVVTLNAHHAKRELMGRITVADLGAATSSPVLLFDWRHRTWLRLDADGAWQVTLPSQEWDYRIVCPLLDGDVTVFGDVTKYASVSDRRVAGISRTANGLEFTVLGAAGTSVAVCGYAAGAPVSVSAWRPGQRRAIARGSEHGAESWTWAPSGLWTVNVDVGPLGWVNVTITI